MSAFPSRAPLGPSVMSPELQRAQSRLEESVRTFSQTQDELMQAMRQRPKTPETSREVAQLQERLRHSEGQMEMLKDLVAKQKQTIKTQSEQISNPKQHYPTPTANRYGQGQMQLPPPPPPVFADATITNTPLKQPGPIRPSTNPAHQHQRQDSSPFMGGPGPRNPQSARRAHGSQDQSDPFRQPRSYNDFGSPDPLTQSFANMGISNTPQGPSNRSNPASGSSSRQQMRGMPPAGQQRLPAPTFNPANGQALVHISELETPALIVGPSDVAQKFAVVLHMSEMYAYSHVNTPSTHKDGELSENVKTILLGAASETTAFRFMSTPFTRYKLVNKVTFQFLIRNVFKPDTFAGFDEEADRKIYGYRSQIYDSTPAAIKHQFLTKIAQEVRKMAFHPGFQAYVHKLARERGNQLFSVLVSMMHQKTSRDWEDLFDLMVKAHELAEMMYSGAEEYRFDFPKIGERFNKEHMEPRDVFPNVHGPAQLELMGTTVRLGLTPRITSRTSTANGYVGHNQILKAFVLIEATRA